MKTDLIVELRRLYEAAIQHAGDLDETASVLALNIAVVHHLPALLDVVEATHAIARFRGQHALYMPEGADALNDELDRLEEIQRAALAALERSGEDAS